jgi:hypothetical protein
MTTEINKLNIEEDEERQEDENIKESNIFRYKFSNEFMDELSRFSKIHQYDDRKIFKEKWNNWIEEYNVLIESEKKRLTELKYVGDILDKMFKSARYYFRKKNIEKKEPAKRKNYVSMQKEFIDLIDNHIEINIKNKNYKPSSGFDDFCIINTKVIKEEVQKLYDSGFSDNIEIKNKIKKTYKNRYFILVNK